MPDTTSWSFDGEYVRAENRDILLTVYQCADSEHDLDQVGGLAAAAPKLLAALKKAANMIDARSPLAPDDLCRFREILAAIAEAEGRS